MQWEKCGVVWQPNGELSWARTHATLPVAHPAGDNKWNVYVGCRNEYGKNQIARLELELSSLPQAVPNICKIAPNPILALGAPGTFDDSGVMPSWLVDEGGLLKLYYLGWNVTSTVPYRISIGLAVSSDGGVSFERYSKGPIVDRCSKDPFFVTTPCVLRDGNLWRMWYSSCTSWTEIAGQWEPAYHVKYAESRDGFAWEITGVSCLDAGPEYAVARPCVFKLGSKYAMIYSYRKLAGYRTNRDCSYRLGFATSNDGLCWDRHDGLVGIERSTEGWDSEMIEYCWLQSRGAETYLLYNGNSFGRSGFGMASLIDST